MVETGCRPGAQSRGAGDEVAARWDATTTRRRGRRGEEARGEVEGRGEGGWQAGVSLCVCCEQDQGTH